MKYNQLFKATEQDRGDRLDIGLINYYMTIR